jgi:hypothetical protein
MNRRAASGVLLGMVRHAACFALLTACGGPAFTAEYFQGPGSVGDEWVGRLADDGGSDAGVSRDAPSRVEVAAEAAQGDAGDMRDGSTEACAPFTGPTWMCGGVAVHAGAVCVIVESTGMAIECYQSSRSPCDCAETFTCACVEAQAAANPNWGKPCGFVIDSCSQNGDEMTVHGH